MNGCIITAIVAGGLGIIGGGLKIADYVYARYYMKPVELIDFEVLKKRREFHDEFKQRLLVFILEHSDQIDLNYLIKLLLSDNPKDAEKAKKYLLDRGLLPDGMELVQ